MELLRTAKRLHDDGFAVIPTGARKEGLTKEWQKQIGDSRVEPNGNFNSDRVHGVGVVTGTEVAMHYLLAIDVDCYDKAISSKMCDYIDRICKTESKLSFRVGEAPKFLVPVLCDQNTRKINSKKFGDSKIEVLGQGQQFVAYGAHPKSKSGSYKWYKREFELDNLPVISMDDIRHIIGYFESLMGGTPAEVTTVEQDDPFAGLTKSEVSLGEAKEILSYIDPDCDYDTWFRVGAALHHEFDGAPEAYDLWDEWSSTGSKYDENKGANDPDTKWASFDTDGDTVSFRTLCQYARKAGADLSAISRKHKVAAEESTLENINMDAYVEPAAEPDAFAKPVSALNQRNKQVQRWLISGYLERRRIAAIYSPPKQGKSFIALDQALSIAYGIEWAGCRVNQGAVLYIAGEGREGVERRIAAWQIENNLGDKGAPMYVTERNVLLTSQDQLDEMRAFIKTMPEPPVAIYIDTYARATAGIEENATSETGQIMTILDALRDQNDASIIAVHHTPKGNEEDLRGNSAFAGALDNSFLIKMDDGVVSFIPKLQKDTSADKVLNFKLLPIALPLEYFEVEDEPGVNVMSAVAKYDETIERRDEGKTKLSPSGSKVLKAFNDMWESDVNGKNRVPAPDQFMLQFGMDSPSEGYWVSDLRDFYKASNSDSDEAKKKAFKRGLDDCVNKEQLAVWDDIVVKL